MQKENWTQHVDVAVSFLRTQFSQISLYLAMSSTWLRQGNSIVTLFTFRVNIFRINEFGKTEFNVYTKSSLFRVTARWRANCQAPTKEIANDYELIKNCVLELTQFVCFCFDFYRSITEHGNDEKERKTETSSTHIICTCTILYSNGICGQFAFLIRQHRTQSTHTEDSMHDTANKCVIALYSAH